MYLIATPPCKDFHFEQYKIFLFFTLCLLVQEEKEVAEKLIQDEELLGKYYATIEQLEKMEDQGHVVEDQKVEIEKLKIALAESTQTRENLQVKVEEKLDEIKETDAEGLKVLVFFNWRSPH